jgi:hypothetical protein
MKTVSIIFLISFAILLSGSIAVADQPPAQPNIPEGKASSEATPMTPVEGVPLREAPDSSSQEISPMMAEIQATIDAAQETVAELNVKYHAAPDQTTALALAKEVARVKHESRIAVMQIQLRYALEEGREDTARKLEEAIGRMTAPPRVGQPRPRPMPASKTRP